MIKYNKYYAQLGTSLGWLYNTIMDFNSIIFIIVGLTAVYLFIKLIVSPIIKAILGIVIFFVVVYLLQRYFNFNLLGLIETYFNKWIPGYSWIWSPINELFNKIKLILNI